MDDLVDFVRGPGYVLDFSDRTFREFFAAQLDIDIDDANYSDLGVSKGKRLRCFLQKVDDQSAANALDALWIIRADILSATGRADPVHNAEGRLLGLVSRLRQGGGPAVGPVSRPERDERVLTSLREELFRIHSLAPQQRGYAFEVFLKRAFDHAGLTAREPFRNVGEQIDGSFMLGDEVYLLEAKWQAQPAPAADLHVFHGKLDQKAAWARGLFVSYNSFSVDGLRAFGTGKRIICMDGKDILDAFSANIPLGAVLERKVRRAAETGQLFVPVIELFPSVQKTI